jgi:glycosyltransferase involved in cell wall biosynthesis
VKKRKIIHIDYRAYDSYFPPKSSPYYYLAGWSSAVARQTLRFTDAYLIENWRAEREVKSMIMRDINGIVCRLFPAKYVKHIRNWSPAMLRELRLQSLSHDIIVHHSGIHSNSLYLISLLFKNIPIVAQHHGDSSPYLRSNHDRQCKAIVGRFTEHMLLKNVDHFFVLTGSELSILGSFLPRDRITQQTMGVDFDHFRPIDKTIARNKLGLGLDKRVLLYVGKFYQLKGVDLVLKAFTQLKEKYDLDLMLVGGSHSDPLYQAVESSGARYYGYLPHEDMPLYYSAADVYLMPVFSGNYYGFDVALIESLACGTPVVSPILKDFPREIRNKMGEIPTGEYDIARCVSEIFENPEIYGECRTAARGYFDWRVIIKKTTSVYRQLFEEYYED